MVDRPAGGSGTGAAPKGASPSTASPIPPSKSPGASGSSPSGASSPSPSSSPAAGEGVAVGGDSSPSPAAAPESAESKGPRAKTGIPGVHVDPAGDGEFGGSEEEVVTGLTRAVKEAKGEGEGKGEAPEVAPATPDPAAPEATVPAKPKFKLGDMEFDSEEQAAHSHKSLRGQAASVAQRARDLANQQAALVQALATAGMTLTQEGKVVRAEGSAPTPPLTASPSAPRPGAPPSGDNSPLDLGTDDGVRSFLDSALNWKQLPTLIKSYEDQNGVTLGPAVAMRLVLETVLPKLWAKMGEHTSSALQPLQQHYGAQQSARAVEELFTGVSEFVYPDGSPAYPELLDPRQRGEVYQVWLDLGNEGVPPKTLLSQKGLALAISLYRDFNTTKARATGGNGEGAGNGSGSHQAPPAPSPQGASVDQATSVVRGIMQSIESARGAVSPDLSSAEGQPFRPSNDANDRASMIRRAIKDSRGKEVIPGVRSS